MAVNLVGEIVNSCDAVTGFNVGNISGDDDFVEGTGAIGTKVSATTQAMFTTALGAGAPYDFSSGGPEEGFHIIMWFNTKSPLNATAGFRILVGDGTNQGEWNVVPRGFYKGGFITQVVDTGRDFDSLPAGSWALAGNPAQLTAVSEMGGTIQTPASIMGNFNNFQLDQMTIGLGVRADGGTVGTPNTFETVRSADEDTNFWGWWSSSQGSVVGKGKLFIGPETGSTTSVFNSVAEKVVFADERVAVGFYELSMRGAGTDVSFDLISIAAANSANARWSLTADSTLNSFSDTNGVWSGGDVLTLGSMATLNGTTLIDCSLVSQLGATLTGIGVLDPDVVNGEWAIEIDNIGNLTDSDFESNGVGHALRYRPSGAGPFNVNLSGCQFSGYAASDGSTGDEAILIDPVTTSADITLNIVGGGNRPSIMEASGYTGTFEIVVSPVTLTITAEDSSDGSVVQGAQVLVLAGTDFLGGTSVSITRSGSTATVTHTSHGFETGNKVRIRGADQPEYNGLFEITVTGANTYTYTVSGTPVSPATGSPVSALVIIDAATDVNGEVSDTRSWGSNQPFVGRVKRGSTVPTYKIQPVSGTIDSANGASVKAPLTSDD